jgi:hypothetical protein
VAVQLEACYPHGIGRYVGNEGGRVFYSGCGEAESSRTFQAIPLTEGVARAGIDRAASATMRCARTRVPRASVAAATAVAVRSACEVAHAWGSDACSVHDGTVATHVDLFGRDGEAEAERLYDRLLARPQADQRSAAQGRRQPRQLPALVGRAHPAGEIVVYLDAVAALDAKIAHAHIFPHGARPSLKRRHCHGAAGAGWVSCHSPLVWAVADG